MPAVEKIPPPRVAVSIPEAAAMLGMGITKFREAVLPHIRVIRRGGWVAIAVTELVQWADRESSVDGQ